jgi:hypothetical protein
VACFLALRPEVDSQQRLGERQADVCWPDRMRGVAQEQAADAMFDGER